MNTEGFRTVRNKALVALAAVVLALLAAGPASAEGKQPTPPAKKGCEIQLKGPGAGQSVVYQHGYSFSILAQDNKTHTYTCDDGAWKETVSLTAGPRSLRDRAIVGGTAGTLTVVALR
jgi:hypothetical protein